MTRSSTKELFMPFKDPEQEFRSSRKHFKTLSLDESRSPDFYLFSDQEEYSEEEELRTNTFSGSDHEDANEHIEKVLENVNLFHIPNITIDQVMLRAFSMSLTGAASRWLNYKPSGSITTWEDLKTKFLCKYCSPTRTAKKMEEINNFQQEPNKNLYQAWKQFKALSMKCPRHHLTEMQETRTMETSDGLADIQAQVNNLRREIKKVNEKVYTAQVGCEQCKSPYYTKDFPLKEEGKALEEAYYTQFGAPFQGWGYRETAMGFYQRNNANPSYQEPRQSMKETLSKFMRELAKRHEENCNLIKEIRALTDTAIRNQRASIKTLEIQIGQMSKVLQERGFRSLPSSTETNPRDHVKSISSTVEAYASSIRRIRSPMRHFIILDMPEDIKVPLILGRPFLSIAHAKIDVFKRKITLRVGEEKIIFKNVKPTSSLIKRVYTLSLREIIELDLEARLMGETLVLNRSLDPFFRDYIELNNLNVPLELRRYQVDDLMPTIDEGKVVEEFRARNDARMVSKKFRYSSDCDHDKKIRIDCAHNLKFSCMIDFAVLEDMNAYRDEGMGDVIFGKPFLREVEINARRFGGMITIYNGNEEVTYQMVRSHPRFKHHTNEQCNKIPPLLKVSEEDKMNEISHSYQKLKSFYNGVLNLGPEYVRDAKMEEWLTRGHISVHETE
nr:hypothetical protein [Tanacetum cinerariifolium]